MAGIPLVLDTDAEDVIWALQTADALWKRGERVDAVVWLRRAAQSAGEMEDDDRALSLAREAAELAEWLTQNPQQADERSVPPPPPPTPGEAVDEFLRQAGAAPLSPSGSPVPPSASAVPNPAPEPRKAPPKPPPSSSKHPVAEPVSAPKIQRVPSAAEVHAGMLDPWAEAEAPARQAPAAPAKPAAPPRAAPAPPRSPPPPPPASPPNPPPPAATQFDADEVITSAPLAPEVIAPRASRPEVEALAPRVPPEPAPLAPAPPAPAPLAAAPLATASPAAPPGLGLDLSRVEALADLPDDAREAFARAAVVQQLAREEEVSGFALALVVEGSVDLSATIVDAPAQRLEAGAILRARGTVEPASALRLVTASERSTIATWDEAAVSLAFSTCPWVEDELRAAGDRFQALVGATMGPLGERLDPSLRASVTDRLRLVALGEHEVFATQGQPIPGLLVVGAGELELVGADGTPEGASLQAGEFLFPNEVLRAAPAPQTVRASKGGALILLADRAMAQELLVTCPPLLEIFSGA